MTSDKNLRTTIQVKIENGSDIGLTIAKHPTECPRCPVSADPRLLYAYLVGPHDDISSPLYVLYQCPSCREAYLAEFHQGYKRRSSAADGVFKWHLLTPRKFLPAQVSELAASISPRFVEVVSQAERAEDYDLIEISGPGYRKALEILIKDYCCHHANTDEEKDTIKKERLGDVIKNRIEHPSIQSMAKLATWLGNDETHYLRKWVDHDLTDLKILIDLTVKWIELQLTSENYESSMSQDAT